MVDLFTYLLQSAATLTVLFIVYWLFLRKDTFFHVNRFYLILSLLVSIFIPLVKINLFSGESLYPAVAMLKPVLITAEKVEKAAITNLSWFEIAGVIYFTGVIIFTIRFIIQLVQLAIITRRYRITRQDGVRLVFTDSTYSPFSFFNLIFIRKEYYISGKLTPVIEHEKIHIRQFHTIDLILTEITVILQWFNPFAWLMGKSLKSVHEYLADEGVLKKGFQKSDYQSLILNEAMGLQINNLTNNFNVSLLKKRITMMTKTRSASWTPLKVGFALPALLIVLFLFTAGSVNLLTAQDTQQKEQQVKETQAVVQNGTSDQDPVFTVVKTMPSYPGGIDAMTAFLVSNIKYPEEAKKKGIQGTVFVTYVVEKDGSVTNVKVLRGIELSCDTEAARVVSAMPKWNPGLNEDKAPVRVQFNLPIKFKLDEKKEVK
jgi:TonB family protein